MNILVVHGPNLNLLGESKKDPVGFTELNARLEAFAKQLGATVKIIQSNHEGLLIDAIQDERRWADRILINPAALTHTSYALRECLRAVAKPFVEVHLEDIRRRETWRRRSVMKDLAEAQVMGKGLASYLDGLERLVTGQYRGARKGKSLVAAALRAPLAADPPARAAPAARPAPAPARPVALPVAKTIGRAGPSTAAELLRIVKDQTQVSSASVEAPSAKTIGRGEAPKAAAGATVGITRTVVRDRIAAKLGNKLTVGALATWAREQWLNVERGAATEMGHRELLDETLQTLALCATPAAKLSDADLIEMMTRLE